MQPQKRKHLIRLQWILTWPPVREQKHFYMTCAKLLSVNTANYSVDMENYLVLWPTQHQACANLLVTHVNTGLIYWIKKPIKKFCLAKPTPGNWNLVSLSGCSAKPGSPDFMSLVHSPTQATMCATPYFCWLLVLYDKYTAWNFTLVVHRKEFGNNSTHYILCN